jgi:hypothetical protein
MSSVSLALGGVPVLVFNNSYNSGFAAQKVLRGENS